jgi:mRNA-degrading endonuclease RelE of RelBE toxin-antitoxin system
VSYQVDVPPPVRKEIEGLPGYVRAQIRQLIRELRDDPKPPRATELREKSNIYRIWLATRWRVAYQVDEESQCVLLLRVRLKEFMDYESL